MLGRIFLLFFSLCVLFAETSRAQYDSTRQTDLAILTDGVLHNITSPLRWNKRNWKKAGEVILRTAVVSIVDQPVNQFWSKRGDPVLDVIDYSDQTLPPYRSKVYHLFRAKVYHVLPTYITDGTLHRFNITDLFFSSQGLSQKFYSMS